MPISQMTSWTCVVSFFGFFWRNFQCTCGHCQCILLKAAIVLRVNHGVVTDEAHPTPPFEND